MFKVIENNKKYIYTVYNVKYDNTDGETEFLVYDTKMKEWYWIKACDCEPVL